MPEITLAARTGWGETFSYDVGAEVSPVLRTQPRSLDRGSTSAEVVEVTPQAPGYYRATVSVRSASPQTPNTFERMWVSNVRVVEVWLLVLDTGGRVTTEYERANVPPGYQHQPGPFRRTSGPPQAPDSPARDAPRRAAGASSTRLDIENRSLTPDVITFQAIYWNSDASAYHPLVGAKFQVDTCVVEEWQFICDPENWQTAVSGATNSQGYYYLEGCTTSNAEYWSTLWTHAGLSRFQVKGGGTQQWGMVATDCGESYYTITSSVGGHAFTNLQKTLDGTQSLFGTIHPFIDVNMYSCPTDSYPNYYSPGQDEIYLCTQDVWGGWGQFIAGHEYGHAFHQTTLWGNVGGNCPSKHFLDTNSNWTCAFSEGFADYFGAATRPDLGTFPIRGEIESNVYFPGCVQRASTYPYACTGGTSYEGALIEAAFAAFLYDLTDSEVEVHDSIAAPGTYIRDIIRTCETKYGASAWGRADGPDEIAYCVENAINPGSYFSPRMLVASQYRESASEGGGWTSARARKNWVWNLYEKP